METEFVDSKQDDKSVDTSAILSEISSLRQLIKEEKYPAGHLGSSQHQAYQSVTNDSEENVRLRAELEESRRQYKQLKYEIENSVENHMIRARKVTIEELNALEKELLASVREDTGDVGDLLISGNIGKKEGTSFKKPFTPKVKKYVPRPSLLIEMMKIKSYRTIYDIFVAFIFLMGFGIVYNNYIQKGYWIDFSLLFFAFDRIIEAVYIWFGMNALAWCLWAFSPNKYSKLSVIVYIPLAVTMAIVPSAITFQQQYSPATAFIVVLESLRLSMKMYSFTFTNDSDFLPKSEDGQEIEAPARTAEQYMYFLFVPCLLWRPYYPRSPRRSVAKITLHLVEFLGCILYLFLIFELNFPDMKVDKSLRWDLEVFLKNLVKIMLSGVIMLFVGFYALLHSWMNAWAELLRFGDRQFYQDWWSSETFGEYYRKWNGVVHDWLHEHIYRPLVMYRIHTTKSVRQSRNIASLATVLASAVIHEVSLMASLGVFRPYLLLMFGGPGYLFTLLPSKKAPALHGILMWMGFFIGTGLLVLCYSNSWDDAHGF